MKYSLSWRVSQQAEIRGGGWGGGGGRWWKQAQGREAKRNDPFSWAAGSSCKHTHHNKPSLISLCPTANRLCGFCRTEYILGAELRVSDGVTVNCGISLALRGQKGEILATDPNCRSHRVNHPLCQVHGLVKGGDHPSLQVKSSL